jgi:oligopeptidase B
MGAVAALLLASVVAAIRVPARLPTAVEYGTHATSPARKHLLQPRSENDDFYYLRNRTNAATRQALAAEQAHATRCADTLRQRRDAVAAFVAATLPEPQAAGWTAYGAWEWRERETATGRVWERRQDGLEEIVLDEAKAPATLVSEYGSGTYRGFVRGVSHVAVAPDGEAVAYTVDPTGDEVYTCEFLPARPAVERVDAIFAWGATSDELYALRTDATGRPHEVWRSRGGAEELVYREGDERFRLEFGGGDAGLVLARSRDAAEVLRVADGAVEVEAARKPGVGILGADARSGVLWRVEARGDACALVRDGTDVAVPGADALEAVVALSADAAVVGGVADARGAAWVVDGDEIARVVPPAPFDEVTLRPDLPGLQLEISAPHRFPRVLAYDAAARTWLETPPPPSAFEDSLVVERLRIADVPATRVGVGEQFWEPDTVVLYAYGAYGARHPTALTGEAAAFLQSGCAVVVCGVRGGGEQGPAWHAAGRLESKAASAADVVACAADLRKSYQHVVARGRSAGGLSVGGALCAAPELFAGVALDVPFLDPVGTLGDASLPLTVNEWEEFGNPHEGAAFDTLTDLSPLARAKDLARPLPPTLLRPAFQDARTGWWESFKFAAEARAAGSDVVVHADDRGHFGPATGPAYAEDVSLPVAFLLAAAAGESFLDDREEVVAVEAPVIEDSFTVDAAPDAALLTKAAELRTEVFSPHLTTVGSRYLQTRRYEDELKEAAGVAVAVSGGEVVGVVSAAAVPADAWYVSAVATAPNWRRRGVISCAEIKVRGASRLTG